MPLRQTKVEQLSAWKPASASRLRRRHVGVFGAFALAVVLPVMVSAYYFYAFAHEQFASRVGFSVQRESVDTGLSLLTGLAMVSGVSSADSDIIYRYIYSQDLVKDIDAELDLRQIWNKAGSDFVFALGQDASLEDLVDYWADQVEVQYDSATRLIDVKVMAFTAKDAQKIAEVIFRKSSEMINRLSGEAQREAIRFTGLELDRARKNLVEARQAITRFRNSNQIVDPAADITAQMALVGDLEQSLAKARIDLEALRQIGRRLDPRIAPLEQRIGIIEAQIQAERSKLGMGSAAANGVVMAELVDAYEVLKVELEFAEASYQTARIAHDHSLGEAQRQTRFLAAHVAPTLAESSRDPKSLMLTGAVAAFAILLWAIGSLTYYSLRDRR